MPQLVKDGALAEDQWAYGPEATPGQLALLPLADWQAATDPVAGLLLETDAEPGAEVIEAPLIAIHFAAFNDGRGLSLAGYLRSRLGYSGDLRAVGDVHHDLVHYLVRCGFSSYVLPDGRDLEVALKGTEIYQTYYQASLVESQPLFRRVSRGS